MSKSYYLTSERNRRILLTSSNLDELRIVRDKLNKLDKDYIKTTSMKLSAVNFEITGGDPDAT
jgi:hypothetical protein|tara:strand:+ start:131 stop:319 length:189 start_codon:yes stop_codon:yes gene_type:complete